MKCPNCGSNDIIEIQGQHYCINCGQLVPENAAKTLAPPPEIVEAVKDTPLKLVVNKPAKPVAKPITNPEAKKTEKLALPPNPQPEPLELLPKHTVPAKPNGNSPHGPIMDIRPQQINASKPTPEDKPKTVAESRPVKPKPNTTPLDPNHPLRVAWRELSQEFWPVVVVYSVLLAALQLALRLKLDTGLVQLMLYHTNITSFSSDQLRQIASTMLAALSGGGILYLLRTYVNGKTIYSMSKQLDRRNATPKQANSVGLGAFWNLVLLDLIVAFWFGALIILEIGLLKGTSLIHSSPYQEILITLGNLILLFASVSLILVRLLATRLVVLAGTEPNVAFRACWHLYLQEIGDLIIWGIEAILISAILSLPLTILGSILTSSRFNITTPLLVVLAIGFVGSFCFYMITVFNIAFWTTIYHALVEAMAPAERRHYMLGQQLRRHRYALIGIIVAVLMIGGLTSFGYLNRDSLSQNLANYIQQNL